MSRRACRIHISPQMAEDSAFIWAWLRDCAEDELYRVADGPVYVNQLEWQAQPFVLEEDTEAEMILVGGEWMAPANERPAKPGERPSFIAVLVTEPR